MTLEQVKEEQEAPDERLPSPAKEEDAGAAEEPGMPEVSGMLSQGYSELPLPRHMMGTIGSTLPTYTGAEHEAIYR